MNTEVAQLVNAVFKKAQKNSGKDTKNGLSQYLHEVFLEEYRFNVSYKKFVKTYERYVSKTHPENAAPKPELIDKMLQYLGYGSFEAFLKETKDETKSPVKKKPGIERILLIILGVLLLGMLSYKLFMNIGEEKRCMTWKEDHYVTVSCDLAENPKAPNEIILYDKTIHIKFKKIPVEAVKVGKSYYYKEGDNLEYFSWYGRHPVTKEHLKPVTQYIYDKYIIPELEKE